MYFLLRTTIQRILLDHLHLKLITSVILLRVSYRYLGFRLTRGSSHIYASCQAHGIHFQSIYRPSVDSLNEIAMGINMKRGTVVL